LLIGIEIPVEVKRFMEALKEFTGQNMDDSKFFFKPFEGETYS